MSTPICAFIAFSLLYSVHSFPGWLYLMAASAVLFIIGITLSLIAPRSML